MSSHIPLSILTKIEKITLKLKWNQKFPQIAKTIEKKEQSCILTLKYTTNIQ